MGELDALLILKERSRERSCHRSADICRSHNSILDSLLAHLVDGFFLELYDVRIQREMDFGVSMSQEVSCRHSSGSLQ